MELNPVFARRLLLACWLDELERPNVPALMKVSGWHRRTIQDMLKSMAGLGFELRFIQDGSRFNDGYYQLVDWGPVNKQWVKVRRDAIMVMARERQKV